VSQRTQEASLANLKFKRILMAGLATAVLFNGLLLFNIQKRRRAIRSLRVEVMQRQAAEEEIRQLAFFDPLTRLPNRRHLLDRLQRALLNANRNHLFGALLFIDLDNFKSLNDTMGHDVGDVLLQQVAQRLRESVREADTVARLGGDEFVILLEGVCDQEPTAANTAEMVSNKIIARLNQPFELVGQKHYSTPSIGAAIFGHRTHESVDELLKHADLAMYQAKASGRNVLRFFDPDMQTAVEVRAAMEADLRHGMECKQFELLYQAQVDDDGQMMGAEALLRWNHPERGVVSPAEFIPLADLGCECERQAV
jgi:diguanylate cyclase (GGDEF)-like protein